ncbi:MAG: UDP-glucose 4-epimerase GalE [Ruminococcus sp.]|jgi:UDP-glucose 4-epimerase|nr:UDP-glucose 4-epimerase GalE [Ruminococcus sp.]
MAVLVTGGTGYIGSVTCVKLLQAGEEVVIADNLSNSDISVTDRIKKITGKNFSFYKADVRDKAAMRDIFAKHKIEACIHFAGLKAVYESISKPLEYYDNNIGGTIALLEIMKEANVKKIVFSSSATVYGNNEPPFSEDMEIGLETTNPYGTTKLFIEKILGDLAISDPEWGVMLLRYFNPIGADESGLLGDDPNGIPTNLMPYIQRVATGKLPKLFIYGNDYETPDGTCIRDYIHVADLARGHINAVYRVRTMSGIDIYNLGTGTGYSVLDIVKTFMKVNDIDVPFEYAPRRDGDVVTSFCDPTKAKREIGFTTEKTLDDMCRDSYNFIKKLTN